MGYTVRQMRIEDYEEVVALWRATDAIVLSKIDSKEFVKRFLDRNMGLSFVALDDGQIIGAVLCSHDGRMGYLSHLVVAESHHRQGIGSGVGRQAVGGIATHQPLPQTDVAQTQRRQRCAQPGQIEPEKDPEKGQPDRNEDAYWPDKGSLPDITGQQLGNLDQIRVATAVL